MTDLRQPEAMLRNKIMQLFSKMIYRLQEHSLDVTLARAGVIKHDQVHAGSSLDHTATTSNSTSIRNTTRTATATSSSTANSFDILCLDSKERLYLILKQYDWLKEFFHLFPQHFYENSFQFVHRIPPKKLPVKVKVVGLGIGGSLAVSGLKKVGIECVTGYDKRCRNGPRSVTSRFQNASWRAYDIAEGMLDEEAFGHLQQYQQRIHVLSEEDGRERIMSADRVQIILGDAVDSALASAERFGADLRFGCDLDCFYKTAGDDADKDTDADEDEDTDIVALFAGAGTSEMVPGLKDEMQIFSWPNLTSACRLWLEIKLSEKKDSYTARNVEVGAEKWHFTIESSRNTKEDIIRIRHNLIAKYNWNSQKLKDAGASDSEMECELAEFNEQLAKVDRLVSSVEENKEEREDDHQQRFDYIFTNAPDNEHNRAKLQSARERGNVVIDGDYKVNIKIASNSMIDSSPLTNCENRDKLLEQFSTCVIVTGGDACVPPNPMAAYGATLACEFAAMLVQLGVAHGHLNAILSGLKKAEDVDPKWFEVLEELKLLFNQYYNVRGLSENYFQWMQTLICNFYSLPPMDSESCNVTN